MPVLRRQCVLDYELVERCCVQALRLAHDPALELRGQTVKYIFLLPRSLLELALHLLRHLWEVVLRIPLLKERLEARGGRQMCV
eukprot:CAMPEP_0115304422 /NCGR_PEP_ID=MMETSP0270-20121206/71455_1 /TAXON_ID=71861 /ORGANISM="Scrippsiella trochoidea, Strain CCMP3099" /LENGTH=83 /DNA_ID=CAMNT_0002722509 /DNA_START=103 /DNA_END=354 /DNA_ORIENTATION=+